MQRTTSFFVFILIVSLFIFPAVAFGVPGGGIVPCEGVKVVNGTNVADCDFDYLLELAKNIMNFFITVSIPLAAIAFAYAGYLFMTAGGNESQVSKAKGIFTKVLIGFAFVLGAWLIVWTITSTLLCDPSEASCGFYNLLDGTR